MCLDRELLHYKQHIGAEVCRDGLLRPVVHAAARSAGAFVDNTQEDVTGTVTLSLYKGNVAVVSRKSENSLYRTDLSSFTMGDSYDQKDAEGFIRILGLPSRSRRASATRKRQAETEVTKMKMWSGRFRQPLDPEFERWQRSFRFDRGLLRRNWRPAAHTLAP